MLPLLLLASDGNEHRFRNVVKSLSEQFRLSEEERLELLPSGRAPKFANRVGWATTHLSKAGLIERPRRGYFTITERGQSLLEERPNSVNLKLLDRYPEHAVFRSKSSNTVGGPAETELQREDGNTPAETIDEAYGVLRDSLAEEVLQQIKGCSPEFFERLVVDLLVKMGYGGTRAEAGRAVGKSGDGGIDGIINEDRLGLDVIYIQAKRWEATIGRPDIQQFAGALQGQKARKGVFITTSSFSKAAIDYARDIESSIILIAGDALAGLMIVHDVGVTLETSYKVKRIDSDYFDEV
ncbi:restriction endonuclease [soil metagenome]